MKPADYLSYYATKFDTVEVDSTFYRSPPLTTVQGWYSKTPPGFVFAAKVPQKITHRRTTMKTRLLGLILFTLGVLSIRMISANPLQQSAQQAAPQPMDKWDALDWSLKNAKPSFKTVHPKNGFVPDEPTAVKIGEATAVAQYGEKQISGERPFGARLRGDVWTVVGTLHPQGANGGTAVIQLSKTDGRILFMTHQE
jgi:Protein of unknown function DUF72/NTF2 fold immunity protein